MCMIIYLHFHMIYSSHCIYNFLLQNCKGKGKTVLTEFDLKQYGIQVSKPVCKVEEDEDYVDVESGIQNQRYAPTETE